MFENSELSYQLFNKITLLGYKLTSFTGLQRSATKAPTVLLSVAWESHHPNLDGLCLS